MALAELSDAMLITLLAMQAVPITVERVTPADPDLARFDLAKAKGHAEKACDVAEAGDDIVICGRRKLDFTLGPLPDFAEKPIRAGVDLPGGARAAVTLQQVDIGGTPSRRVMVGIKLPF